MQVFKEWVASVYGEDFRTDDLSDEEYYELKDRYNDLVKEDNETVISEK